MSWNIRGLNGPLKQSEVKSMIAKYKVAVMGVLETRVRKESMCTVWEKIKLNQCQWSLEHNYLMSDQGRIWVLYDTRQVCLRVLKMSSQFIHCKITYGTESFVWTCVYG